MTKQWYTGAIYYHRVFIIQIWFIPWWGPALLSPMIMSSPKIVFREATKNCNFQTLLWIYRLRTLWKQVMRIIRPPGPNKRMRSSEILGISNSWTGQSLPSWCREGTPKCATVVIEDLKIIPNRVGKRMMTSY